MIYSQYGSVDQLKLKEIPMPELKADEVLIKIQASAVNDYDWSAIIGQPAIYRLLFGLFKPKYPIPGMELSGIVEKVGAEVTAFKAGDAVYGDISEYKFGAFAEYISVSEKGLKHKPAQMSFEEAAAIPHASLLAYQGLIDLGKIQKGEKILINGAGGGVGTFGLQLAKMYDAEVTGVDSAAKLDRMKLLGFDHVIDYHTNDFTRNNIQYDLILDAKTTRSAFAYSRALKPNGRYITVGGTISKLLGLLMWKFWFSLFSRKRLHILALKANKGLDQINQLYETGNIKPIIDGPYPLSEVPRAVQYFGEGKHYGKVIISNQKSD